MVLAKRFLTISALAIGAAGFGMAAPVAAGVVVKSSGPSAAKYKVGTKVADNGTITLQAGDSVTVLTASGTRVISGAGTHAVGKRGPSKRSAFATLTRQRSGARVRTGAVRAGGTTAAARNPNLWNLDVEAPGKTCLASGDLVNLWRSDTDGEATYIFGTPSSDFHVHVTFDDGVSQASLSGEELPLDRMQTYTISKPDGSPATQVEFVVLEDVPEDMEGLAQVLADNGCSAQLELLADRMMMRE